MKFIIPEKSSGPVVNDKRMRKAFLLFPKTIGNECRWLEVAEWEEVCRCKTEYFVNRYYELTINEIIWWEGIRWI